MNPQLEKEYKDYNQGSINYVVGAILIILILGVFFYAGYQLLDDVIFKEQIKR